MKNSLTLNASLRTSLGTNDAVRLREGGSIPGIVYSNGANPAHVIIDGREFLKIYQQAGDSTIIRLAVAQGEENPVIIHDVGRNPVSGQVQHVDFYRVDMTKKLETRVPLVFVGVAPAIKSHGAYVEQVLRELEIECLPVDLPQHLDVDVSSLANVGDVLRVSDIAVPTGITILTEANQAIALAELPKEETIETPVTAEAEAAAIQAVASEKEEKKKEEGADTGTGVTKGDA